MAIKVRLLDMGMVSPLRSQSIFHGITASMTPESDPAILLCRPRGTYVSIGYFQEAEREVDLEYCTEHKIQVIRRQVGGGAVLLDHNQLFYHVAVPQIMFSRIGLPRDLQGRFRFLASPPIAAYHKLGVPAEFKPINDIHVKGQKIGGTGIGEFDHAVVFAGSMMLDFNHKLMSRVLRIPDEKMRDKIFQSLEAYITSLKRELSTVPKVGEIAAALVDAFENSWDLEIYPSMPTPSELEMIEYYDGILTSDEWLHSVQLPEKDYAALKINADVNILHAAHKAAGGMMHATIRLVNDRVDDILISGDFPVSPQSGLKELAAKFHGSTLDKEELLTRFREAVASENIELAGVGADDFTSLLQQVVK